MLIVEDFNTMLEEAGGHTPAIVTFKRGTVRCDHVRLSKPNRILFMGIKPGIFREWRSGGFRKAYKNRIGYMKFPDFMTVKYGRPDGDEVDVDQEHGYDGQSYPEVTWKFEKILTANVDNIKSIQKI